MPRLPRTTLRAPLTLPVVIALVTALAASACSGTEPRPAADPVPRTAVAGPSDAASTSPDPTTEATPKHERTLIPIEPREPLAKPSRSHLLPGDRLPRLADDLAWTRTTDGADGGPVGACQRASLVDIGALDAVQRLSETADGTSRVTQVVARFPDRTSTWRAHEVLRSWRSDCAEELGRRRAEVGELEAVTVRTGHGEAYAATYRPRDTQARTTGRRTAGFRTTGVGIVRKGSWLAVVEIATDADRWPSGWDPTRKAVRRIAATFEG